MIIELANLLREILHNLKRFPCGCLTLCGRTVHRVDCGILKIQEIQDDLDRHHVTESENSVLN